MASKLVANLTTEIRCGLAFNLGMSTGKSVPLQQTASAARKKLRATRRGGNATSLRGEKTVQEAISEDKFFRGTSLGQPRVCAQ